MRAAAVESTTLATVGYDEAGELLQLVRKVFATELLKRSGGVLDCLAPGLLIRGSEIAILQPAA
jgi:hypothetical protein